MRPAVKRLPGIAVFVLLLAGAIALVLFVLTGDAAGRIVGAVTVATAAVALLGWSAPRLLPWSRPSPIHRIASTVDEIASRQAAETSLREERDRPKFVVTNVGASRAESEYKPCFKMELVSGDAPTTFEWHFRGPRFPMAWRTVDWLGRQSIPLEVAFNLSGEPATTDGRVGPDEIGIEAKYLHHGRWRHELYRWPIERRVTPGNVLWDIKERVAAPESWEEVET